jgi:diguanylate cyclase (GGDEF)-like protein
MAGNVSQRRRESPRRLAAIDRRTWSLWALSLAISISLAVAITVFLYPAAMWNLDRIEAHYRILPQLIIALPALVFLSGAYVITKQRELNELRRFIICTYTEGAGRQGRYPADALTGVLDRSTLPDILQRETARADRYEIPLCLTLFDVRGFHRVNESDGNLAADLVLKELARVVLETARQTDVVLRYGADQFLCFLPGTELEGGKRFAARVASACQQSGRLRELAVDCGQAVYHAREDPETVLGNAERELAARRTATAAAPITGRQQS